MNFSITKNVLYTLVDLIILVLTKKTKKLEQSLPGLLHWKNLGKHFFLRKYFCKFSSTNIWHNLHARCRTILSTSGIILCRHATYMSVYMYVNTRRYYLDMKLTCRNVNMPNNYVGTKLSFAYILNLCACDHSCRSISYKWTCSVTLF